MRQNEVMQGSDEAGSSDRGPACAACSGGRVRCDLKNVFIEGMMYAVVVGMAEAYFGLLALEAGLGQVLAGLIVTVPNMLGALLALATPRVLQRVRNLRTWLLICASAQASVYVVLAASAWREWTAAAWLFGVITLYWGIVYSAATAWTTWMGLIVPGRVRTRYFARRSRAYNVVLPAAVLASGVLLHWADEPGVVGDALPWFAGVLLGAGALAVCDAVVLCADERGGPGRGAREGDPAAERAAAVRARRGWSVAVALDDDPAGAVLWGGVFHAVCTGSFEIRLRPDVLVDRGVVWGQGAGTADRGAGGAGGGALAGAGGVGAALGADPGVVDGVGVVRVAFGGAGAGGDGDRRGGVVRLALRVPPDPPARSREPVDVLPGVQHVGDGGGLAGGWVDA